MAKISFADIDAPAAPPADAPELVVDASAAKRIATLFENDSEGRTYFRTGVKGGGCNGFEYIYKLEAAPNEGDVELTNPDYPQAKVLIDAESHAMLRGSTLRFKEDLAASMFVVDNPNAKSSCGCGTSFSF